MTLQEKADWIEAFGAHKEPKFLYSRHNLHMKYETLNPEEILIGRLDALKKYGYDLADRDLTDEEKDAALTLDYLDALLQTIRLRVQRPLLGEVYVGSLFSTWTPSVPISSELDPAPMYQMLTRFCIWIEECQKIVSTYRNKKWADFIRAWHNQLMQDIKHDYGFYISWRRTLAKELKKKG